MEKHKCKWVLLCLALSIITACSDKKESSENKDNKEDGISTILSDAQSEVTVQVLQKQGFNHELVSNGKVSSRDKAELRFESNEVIAHIYVKNGDRVQKGQKLAELDKFRLENKLSQAENSLMKAELELKDVDELDKVPADVMKLAKVKSGYDQTKSQYALAKRENEHATLVAPFDGMIANLFAKPFNLANTSETFCTLIDTKGMEVEFAVLESELSLIQKGDRVVITPYAGGGAFEGSVSEINPLVDSNGMVKVKASVNGQGKLFSGMNVRVSVRRSLGEQLVIPKTAVVLRSGRQVVFTLESGQAKWNYVDTGLENATECIVSDRSQSGVTDGLLAGDTVIVTGNLNLAHEAPVTVIW